MQCNNLKFFFKRERRLLYATGNPESHAEQSPRFSPEVKANMHDRLGYMQNQIQQREIPKDEAELLLSLETDPLKDFFGKLKLYAKEKHGDNELSWVYLGIANYLQKKEIKDPLQFVEVLRRSVEKDESIPDIVRNYAEKGFAFVEEQFNTKPLAQALEDIDRKFDTDKLPTLSQIWTEYLGKGVATFFSRDKNNKDQV